MLLSLLLLGTLVQSCSATIKHFMLFGDSYTDQSREHSIANGSYPGKDYQEVYPPVDSAADGGVQWPWYLGLYGNYTIWNYATGGAVCSNELTPVNAVPDVIGGQTAWFIQDHVLNNNTIHPRLDISPDEFVVVIFIGTNDVGIHSFITDDQAVNVSLADLAHCQLQSIQNLHALGARNFIVNSMIPLQLTGLYSNSSNPTIYYPDPHSGPAWHKRAYNFVWTMNQFLLDGAASLSDGWSNSKQGGKVEYFDTYHFFEDMYNNPTRYFNGSIPPNVTGHCHQCPNATDYHFCGIGDCTEDQRDSYMWWDELHPSEQTGRNLAKEIYYKILGKSKY